MQRLSAIINPYFVRTLVLFLFFIVIRIIESADYALSYPLISGFYTNVLCGFFYDAVTVLIISGWLLIPFVIIAFKFPKAANVFLATVHLLVILNGILLSFYFIDASEPLDHVLFSYSLNDILFAAKSSSGSAFWNILIIIALLVCYLLLLKKTKQRTIKPAVLYVLCALSTGSIFISRAAIYKNRQEESKNYIINNKLAYFYAHAYSYFCETKELSAANPFTFLNQNNENYLFTDKNYPLEHRENTPDVLGAFLNSDPGKKPNIVFIILESFSRSLVGTDSKLGNFAPFLDSLSKKSLYWPNFLSTADRTFNVLPSSLGSLPYSKNGFMHTPDSSVFPDHYTSVRVLHENDYFSRFYVGCWMHYDNMDEFMDHQKTDYLVQNWDKKYDREIKGQALTWGYPDGMLYQKSFEDAEQLAAGKPRFDVFLTIASHAPFVVPDQSYYNYLVKEQAAKMKLSQEQQDNYLKDEAKYASIMYTDDALRNYFKACEKRADFKNTIFFIFGDHAMPELDVEKSLIERYNVPLVIYSPMLKAPQRFEAVSSHMNLAPTLIAYLKHNYRISAPEKVHWMAGALDTAKEFRNIQVLPFMRSNRNIVDYLNRGYLLSNDQLYALKPGLKMVAVNDDKKRAELKDQLNSFIALNKYVCENNKISAADYYLKDFYTAFIPFITFPGKGILPEKIIDHLPLDKKKALQVRIEFDYFTNDTAIAGQPELFFSVDDSIMHRRKTENIQIREKYGQKILPGKWNRMICEKRFDFSKISQLSNIFINSYFECKKTDIQLKNIEIIIKANK